jgi:oxygen-dependent protoporphyrinogen oxidase
MKRLVVIGGGISGLAAAHAAATGDLRVLVLEKEPEPGGKARTHRCGPWSVETGPAAYLSGETELDDLVASAGLDDDLRIADPSAANRFLVRGGRLRPVSAHPLKLARSGLLGVGGLLRVLGEPFVSRADAEESVWTFAARRLGPQVADRIVAPMVLGVFAGDAKRLSLAAAFPRLAALESEHGSLIRGMMKSRGKTSGGPAGPGGTLTSFAGGMQQLSSRLAGQDRFEVRCNTAVERIERTRESQWTIRLQAGGDPIVADALVLACEAWAMARLFAPPQPAWASLLQEIPYPPVAIVALGFESAAHKRVPKGFGALIPRSEGLRMLGVLFDSYLFEGRAPDGNLLVRAFLGGAVDPEVTEREDQELVELVRGELGSLLGVRSKPLFSEVVRWQRAIPQYEIGHLERVASIEQAVARVPGLFLAGNALHGIAFGKAAAAGVRAGQDAATYLAREEGESGGLGARGLH